VTSTQSETSVMLSSSTNGMAVLKIAVFYARLDDKFVPLKSKSDFSNRLEWDRNKFEELKKWLDAHPGLIEGYKTFLPNPAKTIAN